MPGWARASPAGKDETLDLPTLLLLFAVGLVAGAVNVIAGGGSMLTLPVLIFLGLPAGVANGTNRVAILLQNVGATWSFHRRKLVGWPWLRLAVPPALAGVLVGTWAAVRIDDALFERILALVLLAAAAWTLWHPIRPPAVGRAEPPAGASRWGLVAAFFGVGVYGGFIQAGVGFVLLALTSAFGLDLIRGNAIKVTVVLIFTPVALAIFAWNGMVHWPYGLALSAGTVSGALVGVRLQVLKGQRWVRQVVTAAIVVFALRLLLG